MLKGRTAVVTGAAGFIGSHLVRRLVTDGARVVAVVKPHADLWRLADVVADVHVVAATPCFGFELPRGISSADVLFHLGAAGVRRAEGARPLFATNVAGTQSLLEWGRHHGVGRFVHAGSCFEYGPGHNHREDARCDPRSPYAVSKLAATSLVRMYGLSEGLHTLTLRVFTVYGPFEHRGRVIPSAILGALGEEDAAFTTGTQTRDFVHVADVADAFVVASLAAVPSGAILNICTGQATSVRTAVDRIFRLCGASQSPRYGAAADRVEEIDRLSGDPSLAASAMDWTAKTRLDEGLEATIDWFRDEGRFRPQYITARSVIAFPKRASRELSP